MITVAAANRSLSMVSHGRGVPTHGLLDDFQACHSHCILKALPNFVKSWTPSPPRFLGLQTTDYLTRQCPPLQVSPPFQNQPRHFFSICSRTHAGSLCVVIMYITIEERTLFRSTNLPSLEMSDPFHAASIGRRCFGSRVYMNLL
jgi:hypothetical protein